MKVHAFVSAIALFSLSASAFAQSCATPYQGTLGGAGNPSFSGNTCASGSTNPIAAICGQSETLGSGSMDVIQWTVGPSPSNPVNLSLTSAAFTPELAVTSGTCSANAACLVDQTIAAPGTVNGSFNATAGTTYYILVTNLADGNCGAYNLTVPTTPVKLQNFSVK